MPGPPPGFEWDEAKARANWRKHGVSFADARWFDFVAAIRTEDLRFDYGETRIFALGRIRRTLHAIVYIERDQETVRVISLRKATAQERAAYLAAGAR
jgi:uncharacterized DUF497 family protein